MLVPPLELDAPRNFQKSAMKSPNMAVLCAMEGRKLSMLIPKLFKTKALMASALNGVRQGYSALFFKRIERIELVGLVFKIAITKSKPRFKQCLSCRKALDNKTSFCIWM